MLDRSVWLDIVAQETRNDDDDDDDDDNDDDFIYITHVHAKR